VLFAVEGEAFLRFCATRGELCRAVGLGAGD
jgi:hypothetical protein